MNSMYRIFFGLVILTLSHFTISMATEMIINTADGPIDMDNFVAHDTFYSSLLELTRKKVKASIEGIMAHSKLDITVLIPNIDVIEYIILQILQSLANSDLSFVVQLVQSLQYANRYPELRTKVGSISEFVTSNIHYPPSEMYNVVKSIIALNKDGVDVIPKPIEEGIMSMMNVTEIFTEASKKEDIEVMKWLMQSEYFLDFSSIMDISCRQERLDIVKLLIENYVPYKFNIDNIRNCSKENLLQIAVQTQSQHFLKLLLMEELSVDVEDDRGFTPLYLAVKHNNIDISKQLIDKGANVNKETVNGNIALHEAYLNGKIDVVELLINSGSNVIQKNKFGISPMMMAEKFVIKDITRYLFNYRVDIPKDELFCSFFYIAPDQVYEENPDRGKRNVYLNNILKHSDMVYQMKSRIIFDTCEKEGTKEKLLNITMINLIPSLVQSLMNLGARLDVTSQATKDVFLDSVKKGNGEMSALLINKGISVNASRDGLSALHMAALNGHAKIFFLLVRNGADILAVRPDGGTSLHSACAGKQVSIVEYLIKRGLKVNATDSNSMTPLQVAAATGNYDVIATLVKYGADVRFRSSTTPLLAAAISGNAKAVHLLLDKGADIEEKANSEMTPLIAATMEGNEDVVKALLKRGASVNARNDNTGDTALHIAAKTGSVEIIDLLLEHDIDIEIKNRDGKKAIDVAFDSGAIFVVSLLAGVKNMKQL